MHPRIRSVIAFGLLIAIIVVPLWYARQRQKEFRNFRIVQDGVLYRSGQLTPAALEKVVAQYGIKTIVSLRYPPNIGEPAPDAWEESWASDHRVQHLRIQPREWSADDESVPAEEGVKQFLKIMDNPTNHPVLIHCYAGVHRTGSHCAIYRIDYQGWQNSAAIEEMRELGYDHIDRETDVRDYLRSYQRRSSSVGDDRGN